MSPAPKYPKIVEVLLELITTGQLPPGSRVPSEGELAVRFEVARNTLRRALSELERAGLVAVVPGKGRVVYAPGEPPGHADEMQPGYQRIAVELRGQIERGLYAPGSRLPSEADLARRCSVSRETARRALAQLRAADLATVVHGKGWYVREDAEGVSRTS
jgi:DNA-binding GntR family transcriptional regulator